MQISKIDQILMKTFEPIYKLSDSFSEIINFLAKI